VVIAIFAVTAVGLVVWLRQLRSRQLATSASPA
jgi:hypothetical protein